MKTRCLDQKTKAMTLLEAVVVIFVIAVLALVILPAISHPPRTPEKITCVNNLKQLGLAYRIWEGDNHDQYPMELSVTNGGTKELMDGPDAWRTYQVMSNELSATKILCCPLDATHARTATNFGDDLRGKISYFAGLDAREAVPDSLLSGDDNLNLNGSPVTPGVIQLKSSTAVAWDLSRHPKPERLLWHAVRTGPTGGNVGFGDGSVESFTSLDIKMLLGKTGLATNRLAIP